MKRKLSYLLCLFCSLFATSIFAVPREVIIIRHADTLDQKETGIGISAKGQVRAQNFALYFLSTFGKPDAIISAKPKDDQENDSSMRELQTLAPLANYLAEQFPDERPEKAFPFIHKYEGDDYKNLARKLIKDNNFNNKLVVICWDHNKMDNLAKELGAPSHKSPAEDEFDTVWDLKFDSAGKVIDFQVLTGQYPVNFNGSWTDLHALAN